MRKMTMKLIIMGLVALLISPLVQVNAQDSPGAAVAKKVGVYVFPANGQDEAEQDKDESDCYTWAVKQTGYDPINPTTVQAEQVDTSPDGTAVKHAAGGAAAGAAIGAICGDAGKDYGWGRCRRFTGDESKRCKRSAGTTGGRPASRTTKPNYGG